MLFQWCKCNRVLKSLKQILTPGEYQQIDVDTFGLHICEMWSRKACKEYAEAAWSGCLLLQQLTGCNDLHLIGKS
jgi:hypothetical protein